MKKKPPDTIRQTHAFVLAEARANIQFVKASPENVEQAKQINAALANIVAMERNLVMDKAVERALRRNENDDVLLLPPDRPGS